MTAYLFFILLLLLFALAGSIVVTVLARKKGRSAFVFFTLSVFLSPIISLIILLILGDSEDLRFEKISAEEKLRNSIRQTEKPSVSPDKTGEMDRGELLRQLELLVSLKEKQVLTELEYNNERSIILRKLGHSVELEASDPIRKGANNQSNDQSSSQPSESVKDFTLKEPTLSQNKDIQYYEPYDPGQGGRNLLWAWLIIFLLLGGLVYYFYFYKSEKQTSQSDFAIPKVDSLESQTNIGTKFLGVWRGKLGNKDILFVFQKLDSVSGNSISFSGYDVINNNYQRPISGKVSILNDICNMKLMEPGTNEWDGQYNLNFRLSEINNGATGSGSSFNGKFNSTIKVFKSTEDPNVIDKSNLIIDQNISPDDVK